MMSGLNSGPAASQRLAWSEASAESTKEAAQAVSSPVLPVPASGRRILDALPIKGGQPLCSVVVS
jgi:hypothetical protein